MPELKPKTLLIFFLAWIFMANYGFFAFMAVITGLWLLKSLLGAILRSGGSILRATWAILNSKTPFSEPIFKKRIF